MSGHASQALRRRVRPVMLAICCALGLSACGTARNVAAGITSPFSGAGSLRGASSEIDGIRFRTRVSTSRDDPRAFLTATRDAGRNLPAAVEAGRIEAVRHCLSGFGGSQIAWAQGPDRPVEQIALDASGTLVLSGRCVTR